MSKIMDKELSYDFVLNWKECLEMIKRNTCADSFSILRVLEESGVLFDDNHAVKLMWYEKENNKVVIIEENKILGFLDTWARSKGKPLNVNQRADIILTIVCKKEKVLYLSDLKKKYLRGSVFKFVNPKKYVQELDIVYRYVENIPGIQTQ